jgi:penicillin-binding protein 1C
MIVQVIKKVFRHRYFRLTSGVLILAIGIWYALSLQGVLFEDPYSTVILDRRGELMGARIASDGQWRFPEEQEVPDRFTTCLLEFEDKRFYQHPGVDPLAIARAFSSNLRSGERVSGGSTLSMQVIRMAQKNPPRTYFQKTKEIILATRLEIKYSKKEILSLYASHAPFGGNVVGLQTAAWKYYGKNPHELTWSQAATLAVLPNAPSLIHPGKNRSHLLEKRNRLLRTLYEHQKIDSTTLALSLTEPLPEKPLALPNYCPHLTENIRQKFSGGIYQSSLQLSLQREAMEVLKRHQKKLEANSIFNGAILIADNETGEILSYIGNADSNNPFHQGHVNMVTAHRSTGSVLKPLLFAACLNEGLILPNSLIADVPIRINQYQPKNFHYTYDGAVPASLALSRSLNIPAVHLLRQYSTERFCEYLKKAGLPSFNRKPSEYGYSLILGGGEACLYDLCSAYASMARTLNHFNQHQRYFHKDFRSLQTQVGSDTAQAVSQSPLLNASSIYSTFEALQEVIRPEEFQHWKHLHHQRLIAWKTGTSFGNRDAWSIGCSKRYTIGVWLGNADGEGRAVLTGIDAAAPVLFELFNLLPEENDFFSRPENEMELSEVCVNSGEIASELCPDTRKEWINKHTQRTQKCPYHLLIHLDEEEKFRVSGECYPVSQMKSRVFFVLPPAMEQYYRKSHGDYRILPPFAVACQPSESQSPIELLYPSPESNIHLDPHQKVVFEASHSNPLARLYWHIDDEYLQTTKGQEHQLEVTAKPGKHCVTILDDAGITIKRDFEIY